MAAETSRRVAGRRSCGARPRRARRHLEGRPARRRRRGTALDLWAAGRSDRCLLPYPPPVRSVVGDLTVANSGSVGLPYDGDIRSSYLLVDEGRAAVRRVEYDIDRHLKDLEEVSYPSSRWLVEQARSAAGGFPKLNR